MSGKDTIVEAMDPLAVMQLVGKPEVAKLGGQVRERLERAIAAV